MGTLKKSPPFPRLPSRCRAGRIKSPSKAPGPTVHERLAETNSRHLSVPGQEDVAIHACLLESWRATDDDQTAPQPYRLVADPSGGCGDSPPPPLCPLVSSGQDPDVGTAIPAHPDPDGIMLAELYSQTEMCQERSGPTGEGGYKPCNTHAAILTTRQTGSWERIPWQGQTSRGGCGPGVHDAGHPAVRSADHPVQDRNPG